MEQKKFHIISAIIYKCFGSQINRIVQLSKCSRLYSQVVSNSYVIVYYFASPLIWDFLRSCSDNKKVVCKDTLLDILLFSRIPVIIHIKSVISKIFILTPLYELLHGAYFTTLAIVMNILYPDKLYALCDVSIQFKV